MGDWERKPDKKSINKKPPTLDKECKKKTEKS